MSFELSRINNDNNQNKNTIDAGVNNDFSLPSIDRKQDMNAIMSDRKIEELA